MLRRAAFKYLVIDFRRVGCYSACRSRRCRGYHVVIPRRLVAATPRLPRGYSAALRLSTAVLLISRNGARRRVGCGLDLSRRIPLMVSTHFYE